MRLLVILTLIVGPSFALAQAQTPPSAPTAPAPAARPSAEPAPAPAAPAPVPAQQSDLLSNLPVMPPEEVERYVSFQTRTLTRMFGVPLRFEGVLPQMRRADRPLQMLNPWAPARYGNGFDHLSVNPISGRAEGIGLFALRF